MSTLSPAAWKRYYEAERKRLGTSALERLLAEADPIEVDARHAAIFPHTRLEVTGPLVAAVVAGILASGADQVLAIGVLHGFSARGAPSSERRVHRSGEASTRGEFSLDAFEAMLAIAPRPVRLHARYPLHVGEDPGSLPGIEELAWLAARMPVVATADPVHHGIGYGDDASATRDAEALVNEQLRALEQHDYPMFQRVCTAARSDFRNAGSVLAHLLGDVCFTVRRVECVDYAEALGAPPPTWVAGALVGCSVLRR